MDTLAPEAGEDAALDAKRRTMQAAERIRGDIGKSDTAMQDGDGQLSDAIRWMEGAMEQAEGALDAPMAALERAMVELGEAQSGIATCLEGLSFNPGDLDDAEERLFAIRAMARKHDVQPDDLGGFADGLRARLAVLDRGEADLTALWTAMDKAEETYAKAAQALRTKRIKSAKLLDKAMAAELAPLKMERAVFLTKITDISAGPSGFDEVAFTVATNPGAPSGPIGKIASGGELSRFLLALKVCLTRDAGELTLIFDEIDRGVGGATADAVGRRLSELAQGGQVLVVTHSPQVAALGGHHWRVEKHQKAEATISTVVPLIGDQRVDEIARMLSGDTITDAARAAARALM
jgi:DNA repair protein RecN (Recombination protein N)